MEYNWPQIWIAIAFHAAFILLAINLLKRDCLPLMGIYVVAVFIYLLYWIIKKRRSFMPWTVYIAFVIGAGIQVLLNATQIIAPDSQGFFTGLGQLLYEALIVISVLLFGLANLVLWSIWKHRASKERMNDMFDNPIIKTMYTADPAPMVYGDTLYLFTTHDENELVNDFYTMRDWCCFSTKDMVNWTDHGKIFSLDDIEWADDRAWAPQCIEKNGRFYLYCPVHKKDGGMAIAVGIADRPEGPYKDLGHPLVDEGDWNDIDPTVFNDDGKVYLYFGNPELRYVILNDDMVSYDESVGICKIPMTEEAFGKGSHMTGTTYGEGPWFYKRNNLYYMVFAGFEAAAEGEHKNEHLAYAVSNGPTGPWKYGGVIMKAGPCFTNHPGIADFNGHSYLFYHTDELPGGSLFHRSVCVAEMFYDSEGRIIEVPHP